MACPLEGPASISGWTRVVAGVCALFATGLHWVWHPDRRTWLAPILFAAVAAVVLHPLDAPISAAAAEVSSQIGGDLRRELHAWQQFGAVGSIVFVVIVVLATRDSNAESRSPRVRSGPAAIEPASPLTPARRLLDLFLAIAVAGLLCTAMKVGIGRPRPRDVFADPHTILGPLGVYPIPGKDGQVHLVHAWEAAGRNELWSMPSSHTVYAAVLAVFLATIYSRLRVLWVALAVLVGMCRILFDAHWPTDVVIGAGLGGAVSWTVISRFWGVGVLDWLWRNLIDPKAVAMRPRRR